MLTSAARIFDLQENTQLQCGDRSALTGMRTETLVNDEMILIVDDSKFIARAYSKVLERLGYRVLIACDGKTGILAALNCRPSLILLGMFLPDMGGADVLETLKRTPSVSHIPVLVTNSVSGKIADKLIQDGAGGFCEKSSMTQEKLENAISGILKKRLLVPSGQGSQL